MALNSGFFLGGKEDKGGGDGNVWGGERMGK